MQAALFFVLAIVLATGADLSQVVPGAVIYVTLLLRLLPVAYRVVITLGNLQYASKYYEELKMALDRYDEIQRAQVEEAKLWEKQVTLDCGIRVEHLSFHYPNGKQIFEDASLDIPAGHSVAIVGASGEGKTTLLDLLLGLLHPQSGHIWYDDFDLIKKKG